MKKFIWISFDLGVRGDYEGMYSWLDDLGAKECGNGVASCWFSYQDDFLKSLKADIDDAVSLDKRSRIYIVFREDDKIKGTFVVGRRKSAPWMGYGMHGEYDEVDVDVL